MKKRLNKLSLFLIVGLASILTLASCNNNNNEGGGGKNPPITDIGDKEVTSIETSVESLSLSLNETKSFTYEVLPSDAKNKEIDIIYDDNYINLTKINNEISVTGLKVGSTNITLISNNNITKVVSVTISESQGDIEIIPTKITTDFNRKVIGVNEEVQINVYFELTNATKTTLSYLSSDPSVISVSSSGLIKGIASGSASILISVVGVSEVTPITLNLKVSSDETLVNSDKVNALISEAISNEEKDVIKGSITKTSKPSQYNDTVYTYSNNYEVYNNVIYNHIKDYDNNEILEFYTIFEGYLYNISQNSSGEVTNENYYQISDEIYWSSTVTLEEANKMTSLPALIEEYYYSSYSYGVGSYLDYILTNTFFNESNSAGLTTSISDNNITLTLEDLNYSTYDLYSLEIVIENNNFKEISYCLNSYDTTSLDENNELISGSNPIIYDTLSASFEIGEKVDDPTKVIDINDYFYSDFDARFYSISDNVYHDDLVFNLDDNIAFEVINSTPITASNVFDRVEIVSSSNEEVIRVNDNNLTLFAEGAGTSLVTLKSKNVTKTYEFTVIVPELESLSFSIGLPDVMKTNETATFLVERYPIGAIDDIVLEVGEGEEDYVELGLTTYGYNYIKALDAFPSGVDEVTIHLKAYSKSHPEISVTKEITIVRQYSAQEIYNVITTHKYVSEVNSEYSNMIAEVTFNTDNTGIYKITNQSGGIFEEGTFSYVIGSNGNITIASVRYTNNYISDLSFNFSDPTYLSIQMSFTDTTGSDGFDGYSFTFTLFGETL